MPGCNTSETCCKLLCCRSGPLTERQSESARVKCLLYHERTEAIRNHLEGASATLGRGRRVGGEEEESLEDSDCDSPVPPSEDEKTLRMEEVVSCSSRLGSTQSLNDSMEEQRIRTRASSSSSLATSGSCSPLHLATQPSTHSLYPMCEIKHSPSVLSVHSQLRGSVPLASMERELDLSCLSIQEKVEQLEERREVDTEQIIVLQNDNDESYELIRLKEKDSECDEGSDSGYSGPSPDGTIRDSKSPGSDEDTADRKSPFSECSDGEEVESRVVLVPQVIVVQEGRQGRGEEDGTQGRRQLGRQQERLRQEGRDILISQKSPDEVAVVGGDQVDLVARVGLPETRVVAAEVYGRPLVRGERVPVRAEARGEHGEMNMGCYYLMSALDFCWCL